MRESIITGVTPQQKLIGVNNKFGNKGIKFQQGTTRVIYDGILVDGQSEYTFFEDVKSKQFPFTNLNENRLLVGEALAVERAYLFLAVIVAGDITSISSLSAIDPNFQAGDLSFQIATNEVLKPIKVTSFLPEFNKSAYHTEYTNFEFDTQLVIPPLLDFKARFRISDPQTGANTFLFMVLEGTGSIIAPKTTF